MNIDDPLDIEEEQPEQEESDKDAPRIPVETCYRGFRVNFVPYTEEGKGALAGADCSIGSKLLLNFVDSSVLDGIDAGNTADEDDEGSGKSSGKSKKSASSKGSNGRNSSKGNKHRSENHEKGCGKIATLSSRSDRFLSGLTQEESDKLYALAQEGWEITAIVTLVTFNMQKSRYTGEATFMCYNPKVEEARHAIEKFERTTIKRVKGGDHPSAKLSQKEFDKVLETDGEWFYTKMTPLPKLPKGEAYYKKRQSWSDRLIDMSLEHRVGCSIVSFAVIALVIVVVLLIVFFR